LAYLPAAGAPGALNSDLEDPTSTSSGTFGGDVAALKLNIDLSDAGFLPGPNGVHFGDLVLKGFGRTKTGPSPLNGLTVRQFSAVVNTILGGGSLSQYRAYSAFNLDNITMDIKGSFLNGVASTFGTNNLTLP
jgi:hypothetical protein